MSTPDAQESQPDRVPAAPQAPILAYGREAGPGGVSAVAVAALVFGLLGVTPLLGFYSGALGILLGIISLATRSRGKRTATIGLAAGAITVLMQFAIYLPMMGRAQELAKRINCQAQLKSLGGSVAMYMADRGATPPDFATLIAARMATAGMLDCPSDRSPGTVDYFYLAPVKDCDPSTLMACDFKRNHPGNVRCVLYADGSVASLTESAFQAELAKKPKNLRFAAGLMAVEGR